MKKVWLMRTVAAALALVVAVPPATAQTSTGQIRVIVTDADGGALPGVTVAAETVDSVVKRSATTGQNGEALLPALEPSPNYVVTSTLAGFNGARNENVLVTSGQTATIRVTLQLAEVTEELTVVAETPLVDVNSAITGQDITLELTEALPTGRSYQSYLQLVPGVSPDNGGGNPAARSGLNYADINGTLGTSADNVYYIEGINVTDGVTGTFGANMNTEIIQEQKVLTGGIPAEFVGAPGLVSSVITKSGGASFSGSVRYDREDDSLVADNENSPDAAFQRDDLALTLSGPIVRGDKAWFFGSYREVNREDDITTLDTGAFLRTVEREDQQAFLKASWAITDAHTLQATYLDDPTTISGSTSRTVVANRDRAQEQGGDRYIANYTGILGPTVLSLGIGEHNGEVSSFAANRTSLNTIIFRRSDGSTLAQQQLGGAGSDLISERDTEFYKGDLEWFLATGAGDHTIKFGLDYQEHINIRDTVFTGDGSQYRGSLNGPSLAGISAAELAALAGTGGLTNSFFNVNNTSDFNGFMNTVNASSNRQSFYDAFDTNHDGTITQTELGNALRFDTPNALGGVFYDRSTQVTGGIQETRSEGTSLYLQDQFRLSNWTFNVGVRAEEWVHVATTGEEVFTFDWEYAPRISAAWDIRGDGRQKLSGFYGRYYDPIRNNLTNFAGTLSGSVTEEQVFANGQWVTYRTRGGPVVLDATFAPTTETPYTDEILLTYQRDLGGNMAAEFNVFRRETGDIIEDYDLCLYAGECYSGDPNAPGALFLGPEYFGYSEIPTGINFFIATLEGGERTLNGAELVLRKRLSNKWQGLFSYTYSDAEGNTNSDSNADFAGDVLFLDPRAPNIEGNQPGSIEHLLKLQGSYHFDFGLVLGGAYRWNSGAIQNRTFLAFSRHLPVGGGPGNFEYNGAIDTFAGWAEPGTVGGVENPSYGVLDISANYNHQFGPVGSEFFVSIFNALDDQSTRRTQDLASASPAFGEAVDWVPPRSISLGVRLSFGR
ncbi:MAG: hypothetical protein AMXMBFR36_36470 [Acidobacteriota bacterium]